MREGKRRENRLKTEMKSKKDVYHPFRSSNMKTFWEIKSKTKQNKMVIEKGCSADSQISVRIIIRTGHEKRG